MSIALFALVVLWWALIVYAVLGGADFGAGIWDLLAFGHNAERQHALINHALGPVWEANHVWLIFLIVGLFSIFPSAFFLLWIALFIPFTIVLIGIVLRGAAFVFRYYAVQTKGMFAQSWGRVFSAMSLITPFFLGASAAGIASGHLLPPNGIPDATYIVSWTSPFALVIGCMAVALCATMAAIYLAAEASESEQDHPLVWGYRQRALIAGGVTALLGLCALLLSRVYAPILWQGMLNHGLFVVIVTMLIGLATAATLWMRRYRLARALIIAETAFMLGAWGLAQYPYIVPPTATIENSANSPAVIVILLVGLALGMVILIPSLYFLFAVFKLPYPVPGLRQQTVEQVQQKH